MRTTHEATTAPCRRRRYLLAAWLLVLPTGSPGAQTAAKCERAAAAALGACFSKVSKSLRACYLETGQACDASTLARPLARLAAKVSAACSDSGVQQLGFGPTMTASALAHRLREACHGDAVSLMARTFGGPHGATLVNATTETRICLEQAAESGGDLIRSALRDQSRCLRKVQKGRTCDPADVAATLSAREAEALAEIGGACPNLRSLTALTETQYVERGLAQARCMVAAAHADVAPLELDCGPRAAVPVPPRGQWVQVVLDESVWGTRCGNGGPYAFWLRLAPNGSPVENVVIDLQGGGVCVFESECTGVSSGLLEALNDYQPNGPSGGYLNSNASVNPFWDWTKVALPYCTQDVHIGGGVTSAFPSVTVHRFGAVNVRAVLRYVRDVLWAELDATTNEGYRPDRLRVLFGGVSAGGFGVSYNYHYLLDDLRWVHTTAVPDSGLGLNNGEIVGIAGLGLFMISDGAPAGWGALAMQPPYCRESACAVVPHRHLRTAPRLKSVPLQQILSVSNQRDNTQVSTTFFPSSAAWTNAVRTNYCNTQNATGIRYFLPAMTASIHGMIRNDARLTTFTSDGVVLRDFLANAMSDPDSVVDLVEEGTLTSDPNVDPFPCVVD